MEVVVVKLGGELGIVVIKDWAMEEGVVAGSIGGAWLSPAEDAASSVVAWGTPTVEAEVVKFGVELGVVVIEV